MFTTRDVHVAVVFLSLTLRHSVPPHRSPRAGIPGSRKIAEKLSTVVKTILLLIWSTNLYETVNFSRRYELLYVRYREDLSWSLVRIIGGNSTTRKPRLTEIPRLRVQLDPIVTVSKYFSSVRLLS